MKNVEGVNFGSGAEVDDYNNLRTEMHFGLRKSVDESHFYMPDTDDGDKIREETRYALYYIDPRGRSAMIPKEDIKKAIGRSPDALDALLLANRARSNSVGGVKVSHSASQVAARMLAAARR